MQIICICLLGVFSLALLWIASTHLYTRYALNPFHRWQLQSDHLAPIRHYFTREIVNRAAFDRGALSSDRLWIWFAQVKPCVTMSTRNNKLTKLVTSIRIYSCFIAIVLCKSANRFSS